MSQEVLTHEKSIKYLYQLQEIHKERINKMMVSEPVLHVGSIDMMGTLRGYQEDNEYTLRVPTKEEYKRVSEIKNLVSDLVSIEDDVILTDVEWYDILLKNIVAFDMGFRCGLEERE